jgi:hypothetical protein
LSGILEYVQTNAWDNKRHPTIISACLFFNAAFDLYLMIAIHYYYAFWRLEFQAHPWLSSMNKTNDETARGSLLYVHAFFSMLHLICILWLYRRAASCLTTTLFDAGSFKHILGCLHSTGTQIGIRRWEKPSCPVAHYAG